MKRLFLRGSAPYLHQMEKINKKRRCAMKKVISLLVVPFVLFAISYVSAEEKVSASISTKLLPKYVLDNGILAYNRTVVQTDILLRLPSGFYVDLWGSKGFVGENRGNQVSPTVGYNLLISQENEIGIDLGLTYNNLSPVSRVPRGDRIEPFIEVYKKISNGLTPYAKIEVFLPAKGATPNTETRSHLGIRHFWQITDSVALSQNLKLLYANPPLKNPGLILKHYAKLSWFFSKSVSINASNCLFVPFEHKSHKTQIVPGIGLTILTNL